MGADGVLRACNKYHAVYDLACDQIKEGWRTFGKDHRMASVWEMATGGLKALGYGFLYGCTWVVASALVGRVTKVEIDPKEHTTDPLSGTAASTQSLVANSPLGSPIAKRDSVSPPALQHTPSAAVAKRDQPGMPAKAPEVKTPEAIATPEPSDLQTRVLDLELEILFFLDFAEGRLGADLPRPSLDPDDPRQAVQLALAFAKAVTQKIPKNEEGKVTAENRDLADGITKVIRMARELNDAIKSGQ